MSNLIRTLPYLKKRASKAAVLDSYIWIDLEMTGLDSNIHTILEVACIVTTTDLNCLHEGISLVIHQPESVLQSMNSWSMLQHKKTGLTAQCRESKITLLEADEQISNYIKFYTKPEGNRYLAGNSVYMDRQFLEKYMPTVTSLLHYRILDVSSLKILCQHWYPNVFSKLPPKKLSHRAFDDIKNSINELKQYQEHLFKSEA